jgi:hypothetical protein
MAERLVAFQDESGCIESVSFNMQQIDLLLPVTCHDCRNVTDGYHMGQLRLRIDF